MHDRIYVPYVSCNMDSNRNDILQSYSCKFINTDNNVVYWMEFIFIHNNSFIYIIVYKIYGYMKATNGFWDDFVVEGVIKVKKKHRIKPKDHDSFKWKSQNGRTLKINDVGDMHLVNIYKMLVKSIAYYRELEESICLFGEPHEDMAIDMFMSDISELYGQLNYLKTLLPHIAYEIHKRGLMVNLVQTYKKVDRDVAERSENCKADKEV